MELQERDFKVLEAIEQWGLMGLGQVDGLLFHRDVDPGERMRLLFNEVRREDYWGRAYKRLGGLEKAGLIQSLRPVNSCPVYLLTGKGHELLKRHGRAISTHPVQKISPLSVHHEVTAVGVGLVLSDVLGVKVEPSRHLWHRMKQKYPDGKFSRMSMPDLLVYHGGLYHMVEVELTPKYKERYDGIFESHNQWLPKYESRVLYLTGWPSGPEFIDRAAKKSEYGFRVHVASLDNFRAQAGLCTFRACRYPHDFRFDSETLAPQVPMEAAA